MSIDEFPTLGRIRLNADAQPPLGSRQASDAGAGWRTRWSTLIDRMTVVEHEDEVHQLIDTATSQRGVSVIAFVNAHTMNTICRMPERMDVLSRFDYLLRDGVGLSFLMRRLGLRPGLNLNGTDLIPAILVQRRFRTVALYGTVDEFARRASTHIGDMTGTPADSIFTAHGFLPPEAYLELARSTRPACIILGMGTPKQEEVAALLKAHLDHDCVVICGGAIIDFMGGRFKRAPLIIRKLRCEWIYRLQHEPIRLFRRYVIGNPAFLLRAIRLAVTEARKLPGDLRNNR